MNVICLEDEAYYALLSETIKRMEKHFKQPEKWITPKEAMKKLNITSKTTMQKYRDEGRIRFSQPDARTIFYDSASIDTYLEKHAKETF